MPNPYSEIFRAPGAKGFAAAGFLARMPMAMAPIGIVAMLSQTHGEYWLAGAVSASYALTNAVIAPHCKRLFLLSSNIISSLVYPAINFGFRVPIS